MRRLNFLVFNVILLTACGVLFPQSGRGSAPAQAVSLAPATPTPRTGQPASTPLPVSSLNPGWNRIDPGGNTICAHGDPYSYWVRPGTSGRLTLFFEGGGGCWDADTCRDTGEDFNGYYDSRVSANDDPDTRGGVLDFDRPDNPFKDNTVLYVPVCTGDVHWGSKTYTYPTSDVTIHFNGYVNASAALEWAYANVPNPSSVFVTGCSAGSVGSMVHAADIIEHYPGIPVNQVGDSLAFIFDYKVDLHTDWGIQIPSWMSFDTSSFTFDEYIIALANHYPDYTFANYNAQRDNVQVFYTFLDRSKGDEWGELLNTHLNTIQSAAPNYRSFTAGGDNHCVFADGNFYRYAVDGVALRAWVADLAADKDVSIIHCEECSFAEKIP